MDASVAKAGPATPEAIDSVGLGGALRGPEGPEVGGGFQVVDAGGILEEVAMEDSDHAAVKQETAAAPVEAVADTKDGGFQAPTAVQDKHKEPIQYKAHVGTSTAFRRLPLSIFLGEEPQKWPNF